jgi:serine/threonine-protein kinase
MQPHSKGPKYQLKREIACGGMSIVYEAVQAITQQPVALKVVGPEVSEPAKTERLLREARVLGALQHPSIVRILEAGWEPGLGTYLAMEMLEGRSLEGILATRRKLAPREVVAIGREIGRALVSAHVRGIVHRDVKPGNIFVSWDPVQGEKVKLIDFGIAKLTLQGEVIPKITRAGEVLGTIDYMAPEQVLRPEEVDGRSDQYALAAVLYEALSGQVGASRPVSSILGAKALPPLKEIAPDVPLELAEVVGKALSLSPDERYPSMTRFVQALEKAAPPSAGPVSLLSLSVKVGADGRLEPVEPEGTARPAPSGAQRRRFPRAPYVAPVRVVLPSGENIDGRSEDISEGGMLLLVDRPCSDGTVVQVRFSLPTTGKVASAAAVTRWVRDGREKHALGLEFVDIAPTHREAIGSYVGVMARLG